MTPVTRFDDCRDYPYAAKKAIMTGKQHPRVKSTETGLLQLTRDYLMQKNRHKLIIILGILQLSVVFAMIGWMLLDAYRVFIDILQRPDNQLLLEPIVWHKVGEFLLVLPIGVALAAFFMFWNPDVRRKYIQITAPLMLAGGLLNLLASWGFHQKPSSEFNHFMVYFGAILFIAGVVLPLLLKWIHQKRLSRENEAGSSP